MPLAVTAAHRACPADDAAAAAAAARHGLPLLARRGGSLARLAAEEHVDALLLVGARDVALWTDGRRHRWNGGMGELRVRRLARGEASTPDRFLEAAALREGDALLDATLGLAMDALVASWAVGEAGRVVGVEASPALAALVAESLARHPSAEARRIEVRAGDAADVLRALPPRSFDVVAFDPMFRRPAREAPGFDVVRRFAVDRPLDAETLARARVVARRWVVVKDGAPGWDLARLGLAPLPASRSATRLYARIPPL